MRAANGFLRLPVLLVVVARASAQSPELALRKEGHGPMGARSISSEDWDMETFGKQVMVAFVKPEDPAWPEFTEAWTSLASVHEDSAYTGVYEVDCVESKDLCQKAGKVVGPFIKHGQPSTNLSSLELAAKDLDIEALNAIAAKLSSMCSLRSLAGCTKEERDKLEAYDRMTTGELEETFTSTRERLAEFFGRRRAHETEHDMLAKGIVQAQRQMKDAQTQRLALPDSGLPEAERKTKDTELGSKEGSWRNAWRDRIRRRDQSSAGQSDLDAELERLTAEAKSADFNLKRIVLDAKHAKEGKKKAHDEL